MPVGVVMTPREAVAARLVGMLTSGEDRLGSYDDALRAADELIETYQRALRQPMRTAKRDGRHVLGWHEGLEQWCKVRCVPGCSWASGLTMWQPMPPAVEDGA